MRRQDPQGPSRPKGRPARREDGGGLLCNLLYCVYYIGTIKHIEAQDIVFIAL